MEQEYHIKKSPNFSLIRKPNEDIDSFITRFKRKTKSSKVLVKAVEKMFFVRPAEKKRQKRNKSKFFRSLEKIE